jgi:type I restriction enzyme S subunit
VRSLTDADENHNVIPEDLSNYKVALAGNLVINKMKAWQGSMGIAPCDGIVSPAYFVFEFRIANHAFGQRLLRSKPYVAHFGQASDGVRVGQWDLSVPGMRQIPVLVPPPDEQAAIVRFLDWANGRLDRAIRAKRKVIALLNEQKQAIIHRAVTRGLDPSVPLKSSGITWLGEIPQHWEVRKLRHLSRQIIDGTHFTPDYRDEGVAFIRVTDIHKPTINQSKLRRISKDEHMQLNKRCNPEKGDLLLSKNGTIGVTKVVDWDFPCSIFVSLCLIKPIKAIVNSHFISFAFAGGLLAQQIADTTKTTSVTNLHLDKIRTLVLPLPPLHEQSEILVKSLEEIAPIDIAISRFEREVELLREYRTRLVADIVTGKLDVREAASRLPDEAPLETAADDIELTEEMETADEETAA